MRTMACPGLTHKTINEIISGKKTTHTILSASVFARNYRSRELTHISLPDMKAVEIIGKPELSQKPHRVYSLKIVDYLTFTLGAIVPRRDEDTVRIKFKVDRPYIIGLHQCVVKTDMQFNGLKLEKGENVEYKLSNYPLISGDRYLVFRNKSFEAGFSEQEFHDIFEVNYDNSERLCILPV